MTGTGGRVLLPSLAALLQERTLCAILFRRVTKGIAHRVRSYGKAIVVR